MARVTLDALTVRFGTVTAVDAVSLELHRSLARVNLFYPKNNNLQQQALAA